MSLRPGRPGRFALLAVAFACLVAARAAAQPVVLQNDSGPPTTPCQCFIPMEEAAAWLTSSCHGDLVELQVEWKSTFGGAPSTLETALRVYASGTFPAAGAVLQNGDGNPAVVTAPTLVDQGLNAFRFLDPPANTLPLQVPVNIGQTFVVSLEFLNQNDGNQFAASTTYDSDSCQSGLNTVFAQPGGWADACLAGVPGDWVIRAVVDCSPTVPATGDWGALAGACLLVTAGAVALARRRAAA